MPAIYPAIMSLTETGRRQPTESRPPESRRHPREAGRSPIVLETDNGWLLRLPVIDLSPGGAKVRLTRRLTEGEGGRVYFLSPHWHPRVVEAVVWRIDLDGIVLRFNDVNTTPP